jgi:hypothetical protein
MTFNEFLEKLNLDEKNYNREIEWNSNYHKQFKIKETLITSYYEVPDDKKIIEQSWEVGGVRGGSCWDSSNPEPYTKEDVDTTFTKLDDAIMIVCPQIGFLQYKRLIKELVITSSFSQEEYYGNCTDYSIKRINLLDFYNWLVENKLLED